MPRPHRTASRRLLMAAIRVAGPENNQLRELIVSKLGEYRELLGEESLGEWVHEREDLLAGRVLSSLRDRAAAVKRARDSRHVAMTIEAARQLRATAEQRAGETHVDVTPLLGQLLAAASVRFFVFERADVDVSFSRATLRGIARHVRFADRSAWFDRNGLHVRWRAGRGGLDLRSEGIPSHARDAVLRVSLVPASTTVAVARPDSTHGEVVKKAWFAEALFDLALP